MLSKKRAVNISSGIFLILLTIFPKAYARFLFSYVFIPLGIMKLPDYLGITIAIVVGLAPVTALLFLSLRYVSDSTEPIPSGERFSRKLIELDTARTNLLSAIEYLDDMKKEIGVNYQKQEELNAIVKKLESASKESADELRTKLEAIGMVTKWKEVNKVLVGFLLGILASLIASAIWSVVLQSIFKSGDQP